MGNFTEHSYDPQTDGSLESIQKRLEQQQKANGTFVKPSGATVSHSGKRMMEVNATGGVNGAPLDFKTTTAKLTSGMASPGLRPGHIVIGGVETTIEGAIAAGLMTREDAEKGKLPFDGPAKAGSAGQAEAQGEQDDADASEAEKAVEAASRSLVRLDEVLGSAVVDAVLGDAAESGEMPDFDNLPEGTDQGEAIQVIGGFIASAQAAFQSVGASLEMVDNVLTADELRAARHATIAGDTAKLRHFGETAVERLAQLPQTDPEGFADMLEDMTPAERKAISQNDNGEWVITIPGRAAMSYGAAVRAGIVRV